MAGRVRFETLALALLISTMAVIAWGAVVRVTGSGAGCADHWPLCNGEFIPRSPKIETLIELTHRVTSSLSGLLAIVVFVAARRLFPAHSPVRAASAWGLVLMLLEGAIGALLVKRGLVAKDASQARALVVGLHLCNTFLLLAAQALTVHFARGAARWQLHGRAGLLGALASALALALALGASGAITALGDTLFPAASLDAGVAADWAPSAHFLVRLRVYHPLLAVIGGALLVYLVQQLRASLHTPEVSRWALAVTGAYLLQLALGALNLVLLAPAPVQIAHLVLADLVWLSLVMLAAHALGVPKAQLSLESAAS